MSNILLLQATPVPAFAFLVSVDGDWLDSIYFPASTAGTPPPPIDITGIRFLANFRKADGTLVLSADTAAGTLTNNGPTGFLSFNFLAATRASQFQAGASTADMFAIADGYTLNLSETFGPMALTIRGDSR